MKLLISILLTITVTAAQSATTGSVYTDVSTDKCVTIDSSELQADPEIDYYEGICPAYNNYGIMISGGDIRYSLYLTYKGKDIQTPHPMTFHDMGSDKIEWRYVRKGKTFEHEIEFTALIYRLNYAKYNSETGKSSNEDTLVVMRLNKENSCMLGVVPQQKNMNEIARAMADNQNLSCMKNVEEVFNQF